MLPKKSISVLFLFLLFIISGLFLWKYLDDYYDYKKCIKSNDLIQIKKYLELHPNGRFKFEINQRIEELAFARVKKDSSDTAINDYLNYSIFKTNLQEVLVIQFMTKKNGHLVREFMSKYPQSRFSALAEEKLNQLWEDQVVYFDSVAKPHLNGPSRKLIDFYRKLLLYMKDKDQYGFVAIFNSRKQFKSFKNYSEQQRKRIKSIYQDFSTGYPPPEIKNVFDISTYFPALFLLEKERATGEKLGASVFSLFNPDFFTYRMVMSDENIKTKLDNEVEIEFNYTIKNEENQDSLPGLREYINFPDSLDKSKNRFLGYAMAIHTEINFILFNPGNKESFKISRKIEHPDMNEKFEDLSQGYRKLIELIFNQFYKEEEIIFKNFNLSKL